LRGVADGILGGDLRQTQNDCSFGQDGPRPKKVCRFFMALVSKRDILNCEQTGFGDFKLHRS
jgi:hypothetical protein